MVIELIEQHLQMVSLSLLPATAFDVVSDSIFIFDTWGKCQYCNKQAAQSFPLTTSTSTIFDFVDILLEKASPNSAEEKEIETLWQNLQLNKKIVINDIGISDTQASCSVRLTAQWIKKDELEILLVCITTPSESPDTSNAQRALAKILGHELKQPLNLISTYNYYITKYLRQNNLERVTIYLSRIDQKVQLLNKMLSDISQNVKTSLKDIPVIIKPIKFYEILASTIEDYQKLHPNRKFTFRNGKKNAHVIILADATRYRQVLVNIFDNCIKYSPDGTDIATTVIVNNKTVTITITDQGNGIDPAEIENIFKPYYRIKNDKKSAIDGLGLGLNLTKLFMKRQRGDITVSSEIGKGTTFSLIFKQPKE